MISMASAHTRREAAIRFTLAAISLADDPSEVVDAMADILDGAAVEAGRKGNSEKRNAFVQAANSTRKAATTLREAAVTSLRSRKTST